MNGKLRKGVYLVMIVWVTMGLWACPGVLAQGTAKPTVSDIVSRVANAMARLEFRIDPRIILARKRSGIGICIDASKRIFLTLDVPSAVPREQLKDFVLIVPGNQGKRIKAKLLNVDVESGVAFLQADEGYKWSEIRFPRRSNLKLGQRVISVGLLGEQFGNMPYFTEAKVSAVVRVPGQRVFVTAGELASLSSPVFAEDGRPVGIVGGDMPLAYRMLLGGRWVDVGLAGREVTRFFVPVEEFSWQIPTRGRAGRMPWMGVVRLFPVSPGQAVKGLDDSPAAILGQVLPDGPAARAGLRQGDVVIALNGKPLERMATPTLTVAQFKRHLSRLPSNGRISLTVLRDGKKRVFRVKLEPVPTRSFEAEHYYNNRLGIVVRDMVIWDKYVGRTKPLLEEGVIVENIRRDSPAAKAGLRPGDLIMAVNKAPIKRVALLKGPLDRLTGAESTGPIDFIVWRGDKPQSVRVSLE